jgi:16S rRNA C1402 (ribose-2'-O) methylase RsmI
MESKLYIDGKEVGNLKDITLVTSEALKTAAEELAEEQGVVLPCKLVTIKETLSCSSLTVAEFQKAVDAAVDKMRSLKTRYKDHYNPPSKASESTGRKIGGKTYKIRKRAR